VCVCVFARACVCVSVRFFYFNLIVKLLKMTRKVQ